MVELDALQGRPGALGGELGWAGPLAPEVCQRLGCDGAVTRVLVTRHPSVHGDPDHDAGGPEGLAALLQTAVARLPSALGGVPSQPLEVGRTSRVVTPAQRSALAVRDGGCSFPDCDRPLAWCEAHHVWHWADGGPTDLENLVLLCRAHHRAVHEGGWRLERGPEGRWTATPPHRRPRAVA
jgi:HNH endonuclease